MDGFANWREPNALRRYELLSEHTRDIVLFIRPDGQIVEANRAAVVAYGYDRRELLSLNLENLRAENTRPTIAEQMGMAGDSGITFETMHRRKDGSVFPVEVSASRSEFGGVLLSLVRDITVRRRIEEAQAVLAETDQRILRREPIRQIVQFICDRVSAILGFSLVWIGAKEPDGSVTPLALAGASADFLAGIHVRWDETPEGAGPTGTAIRTGQLQLADRANWDATPWRPRVEEHALGMTLSIPLTAQQQTLGALSIYTARGEQFDETVVTDLKRFADQVAISLLAARDQEQIRLQTAALEAAANAVVITDVAGHIRWVNPAFCTLTGYTQAEALAQTPAILKSGNQTRQFYKRMWDTILAGRTWQGELYNRRKDGTLYVEEMTITPVKADGLTITHFVAVKQDVSERKRQEEQLRYLAMHDPVTDLHNRRSLTKNLERVVERCRQGHQGALLLLDMDNFKLVNDSQGHAAGDHLLTVLGQVLRGCLRESDLLARWGGDEFAVLLEDVTVDEATELAERLRQAVVAGTFRFSGRDFQLGVSVGIAAIDGATAADAVMSRADRALYAAKEMGKNRVVVSSADMPGGLRLADAGHWAARIRTALDEGRFVLHFQPVVRLRSGTIDHHEALLRLQEPGGDLIAPGEFLPVAERFGLMPAIDRWVMGQVLQALQMHPDRQIFVNLSGESLSDEALLADIEQMIRGCGDAAFRLSVEITETAAVRDLALAQRWMLRLKSLGCRFALDDFGTGFSSFGYLRTLPVDYVKIAGSFVRNLDTDATHRSLVQAMIAVAHAMGKEVVAEWVETGPVADALGELAVEYGQGFFWGKPDLFQAK